MLITKDLVLRNRLERVLADSFRLVLFSNIQSSLDYIYSSMPDLMVLESNGVNDTWARTILSDLKNDPIFGQIPIMAICEDDLVSPDWHHLVADDYVGSPPSRLRRWHGSSSALNVRHVLWKSIL